MNRRLLWVLYLVSLLAPLILLAINANRNGLSYLGVFNTPKFLVYNWFYMTIPHLLFGILALRTTSKFWPMVIATLIALTTLLVGFQSWIWLAVPGRESGTAWMLYIPLWLSVLVVAAIYATRISKKNQ
jgi:hypothetical protein